MRRQERRILNLFSNGLSNHQSALESAESSLLLISENASNGKILDRRASSDDNSVQPLHILSKTILMQDGSYGISSPIKQIAKDDNKERFAIIQHESTMLPCTVELNALWERYADAIKKSEDLRKISKASISIQQNTLAFSIGRANKKFRLASKCETYFFGNCQPSRNSLILPNHLIKDILECAQKTSRPVFFLNTDVNYDVVKEQFGFNTNINVIKYADWLETSTRQSFVPGSTLLIITPFIDSIDLYKNLSEKMGVLTISTMVGGIWSLHHIPEICPHCAKTVSHPVTASRHSMNFINGVKERGDGCSSCCYGYIGILDVCENINHRAIENVLESFVDYEKQAKLDGDNILLLISIYANHKSHTTIYSSLDNLVNQLRICIHDATRYRL